MESPPAIRCHGCGLSIFSHFFRKIHKGEDVSRLDLG
jgi:hypothetical protein